MQERSLKAARFTVALACVLSVSSPAAAQVRRDIYFYNACSRPIQLLISHADQPGNWHVHGWYHLRPGQGSYFQAHGITLTQRSDHYLYVYAEATDGSTWIWDGNFEQRFQGAIYGFRQISGTVADNGSLYQRFTCN